MSDPGSTYVWIDESSQLEAHLGRLHGEPRVAVDTESNSMHAYHEKVCVVQISAPGLDLLIDACAVSLAPLGPWLADPRVEKVFHGADYDILCFKRAFGFQIVNLFDTVIAARLLGWPQVGLAAILAHRFGHLSDKRFQRYDWGQRPLSPEALAYAAGDTRFLLPLRELQWAELCERELADEFVHACQRQTRVEPRLKVFDADGVWKIKGIKSLDDAGKSVLHALYQWREEIAASLDRPVFRIMGDHVMLEIAKAKPDNLERLHRIPGIPRPLMARRGAEVLELIAVHRHAVPPRAPRASSGSLPRAVVERFDRLRAWRKDLAAQRGIEADLVVSKQTLWAVAERNPSSAAELERIAELDDWERERYGGAILASLHRSE